MGMKVVIIGMLKSVNGNKWKVSEWIVNSLKLSVCVDKYLPSPSPKSLCFGGSDHFSIVGKHFHRLVVVVGLCPVGPS